MEVYRPAGVIAFIVLFLLIGLVECLVGVRILVTFGSEFYSKVAYWSFLFYYWSTRPMGYAYLYLVSGNFLIDTSSLNIMPFVASFLLGGSILNLVTSAGLFYMRRWGYKLSILIGVLNMVCGLLLMIFLFLTVLGSFGGVFLILFGIMILWYFLGDVKYEFE